MLQRRESRYQQGQQQPRHAADAAPSHRPGLGDTVRPPRPVHTAPSGHFAHGDTGLGRRGASGRPSRPRMRILLAGVRGGGRHQRKNG